MSNTVLESMKAGWTVASPWVFKGVIAAAALYAGHTGVNKVTGKTSIIQEATAAKDSVRQVAMIAATCSAPVRDTIYLPAIAPVRVVRPVPKPNPPLARDTLPRQAQSQGQGVVVNVYVGRTDSTGVSGIHFDTVRSPPVLEEIFIMDTVIVREHSRAGVVLGAIGGFVAGIFVGQNNPRSSPPAMVPPKDDDKNHGRPWDKGREHGRKP